MPGRWTSYLLLVILSIFLALVVCEAGLRVAGVRFDGSFFTGDSTLGWALRPRAHGWHLDEGESYVEINGDGQRDRERQAGKQAGLYRVAVLGDSMVEARQVPLKETFVARAEGILGECPALSGRRAEVLNFGVSGYGTAQEFLLLKTKVWKYEPDLVALTVYFGNDLFDNSESLDYTDPELRPHFVLRDGALALEPPARQSSRRWRARAHDLLADIMNDSRILLLLDQAWLSLPGAISRGSANIERAASHVAGVPSNYAREWPYVPAESHPELEKAWSITEMAILKVRDEVIGRGVDFLLLVLPMTRQMDVGPKARESMRDGGLASHDYSNARLAAFARSHGIALLDFTKALVDRARRDGARLDRFPNSSGGGHLNETGHLVVAETFSSFLCERLASRSPTTRGQALP